MICCSTGTRAKEDMGAPVTWSLKLLMVLALLYGSINIVRDKVERRRHQSTAVYCGIGERQTLCENKLAFCHFVNMTLPYMLTPL